MKVKLKRDEVHLIYTTLFSLPLDVKFSKIFNCYVEMILASLKDLFTCIDTLKSNTEPSKEYLKFMEKRSILEKYYTTEVNGQIVIKEETREEFDRLYKELMDEYYEDVIEHDSFGSEVGNFLNEVIEVEIEKIPFKYFPENLSREFYQILNMLRKESDAEIVGKFK